MWLSTASLFGLEQQSEIRGSELVVGIETQSLEHVVCAFASRLEFGLPVDVGLDLNVLADAVDRIEGDGVALEREALSAFRTVAAGSKPRFDRIASIVSRSATLVSTSLRVLDSSSTSGPL